MRRMGEQRPEALRSLSECGAAMRMVERCVMDQSLQHTEYDQRWVGTGKRQPSSRERNDLNQARTASCRMEKTGNRRSDMRSIESTASIDKLATTKAMNNNKYQPSSDMFSVSFVAVFEHTRGSLTAGERKPFCVCFVVRNLKMKSTFSGGVRGGKRFAARSKLQATVIA